MLGKGSKSPLQVLIMVRLPLWRGLAENKWSLCVGICYYPMGRKSIKQDQFHARSFRVWVNSISSIRDSIIIVEKWSLNAQSRHGYQAIETGQGKSNPVLHRDGQGKTNRSSSMEIAHCQHAWTPRKGIKIKHLTPFYSVFLNQHAFIKEIWPCHLMLWQNNEVF